MRKEFNVTGSCNPQWHYMVSTAKRFEAVENLGQNNQDKEPEWVEVNVKRVFEVVV